MYAKLSDEALELFQWDTGKNMLVSEDVDRIDFQFRNQRKIVYGVFSEDGIVPIPDVILQEHGILDCLIMRKEDGIYTIDRMEIPVIERPMPPGYVMTKRGQVVTYDDLSSILGEFELLKKTGDTMLGDLNMDGHMVTNLDDAEQDGDAVSKHFADTEYVKLAGSTMRGRLYGLQEPVANDEPAIKQYVDKAITKAGTDAEGYTDQVVTDKFWHGTATIPASGWSSASPSSVTVSVSGVMATDTPIIDANITASASVESQSEAYSLVYRAVPGDGSIVFYAKEKPTVDIPIKILCIRK